MANEFNRVAQFNQRVLNIHSTKKQVQEPADYRLSYAQLIEEASEFLQASKQGDYVKCVDAAIDSIYFGLGILYKLGLTDDDYQKCFSAVHWANMTKTKGVKEGRKGFDAKDAIKPKTFTEPDVKLREILCDEV